MNVLAIYHCTVKTISRGQGRSAVGAAAYRAGEKLYNSYDGITHDYTKKGGVEYSQIILPNNAPVEYEDRETLWNAVEHAEKRINSRTAREIEVALPAELTRENQIKLIQEYARTNFMQKGMCVDFSIHDKGDGNPHAHIMITTREVTQEGFTSKNREWDKKESLETWRENWAIECNKSLEKYGFEKRIDHRSYKDQGIDKEPTIHLGKAHRLEKRGINSERGNLNREIQELNALKAEFEQIKKEYMKLKQDDQETPIEQQPGKNILPEEKGVDKLINEQIPEGKSTAEEIANKMHNLKMLYVKTEREIQKNHTLWEQLQQEKTHLEKNVDKIIGRINKIEAYTVKIHELSERKQALNLFKGQEKKQLEEQIKSLGVMAKAEEEHLYLEFNVSPKEVAGKIQDMENQYKENLSRINSNRLPAGELELLKQQLSLIELAYKKEKILLEENPDKQGVEELLKQRRLKSHSMYDTMQLARMESKLNHIHKMDLNLIVRHNTNNTQLAQIVQNMQHVLLEKGISR